MTLSALHFAILHGAAAVVQRAGSGVNAVVAAAAAMPSDARGFVAGLRAGRRRSKRR
jgi:hypothetical protein